MTTCGWKWTFHVDVGFDVWSLAGCQEMNCHHAGWKRILNRVAILLSARVPVAEPEKQGPGTNRQATNIETLAYDFLDAGAKISSNKVLFTVVKKTLIARKMRGVRNKV
jgi:hypothetical protein